MATDEGTADLLPALVPAVPLSSTASAFITMKPRSFSPPVSGGESTTQPHPLIIHPPSCTASTAAVLLYRQISSWSHSYI